METSQQESRRTKKGVAFPGTDHFGRPFMPLDGDPYYWDPVLKQWVKYVEPKKQEPQKKSGLDKYGRPPPPNDGKNYYYDRKLKKWVEY